MQRLDDNETLELIPLFPQTENLSLLITDNSIQVDLYLIYQMGADIINDNESLLKQYHRLPHHRELSQEGEVLDEDALRAIFIIVVALDDLKPHVAFEYYLRIKDRLVLKNESSSVRLPNGSKFCTDKALEIIISSYIYSENNYKFLHKSMHETIMNQVENFSITDIENFVMRQPEPGYMLILEGRISQFLTSLSEMKITKDEQRDDVETLYKRKRGMTNSTHIILDNMKKKLKRQKKESSQSIPTDTNESAPMNNFIRMIKTDYKKAVDEAQTTPLQKLITENATIDQFIEIIKTDRAIADTLIQSTEIIEFVVKTATVDQLIEIIKANTGIIKMLSTYPLSSAAAIKKMEQDRATQFREAGLFNSEEYCSEILGALGHVYLKRIKLLPYDDLISKTGVIISREVGRIIIDRLQGNEISPSRELAILVTKICDLNQMKQSIFYLTSTDNDFESYIKHNQNLLNHFIESSFSVTSDQMGFVGYLMYELCQYLSPIDYDENMLNSLHNLDAEKLFTRAVFEVNRQNESLRQFSYAPTII